MALKALLDSIEGLDDGLKALYKPITEGDNAGKFVLDVESVGGFALEDVTGLKNAFATTKQELTTAKQAVQGYEGLPKPSEIKTKLDKLAKLEKLDPEKEADRLAAERAGTEITAIKAQHEQVLAQANDRNSFLTKKVEDLLLRNEAAAEIAKQDGDPELLMPFVERRLKMVEKDGDFAVQVLDDKGQQEWAVRDNRPVEASVADLVAKFKANPKFGVMFKASGNSGGGAQRPNNAPAGGQVNPWMKATSNLTEQMKIERTNPALASAMKAQAGFTGY